MIKTVPVTITRRAVSATFSCPNCRHRFKENYDPFISTYAYGLDMTCPKCKAKFKLGDLTTREE